jgi:uncharacterized Zn-binding protein involved in type VI secretion
MGLHGVARAGQDHAGGIIAVGANSVITENRPTACINLSTIGGPPNVGDVIVNTLSETVFAENKPVAVTGAVTGLGISIGSASTTVFAHP